jgi:dTDP-4-dehydrorhamnose reductase
MRKLLILGATGMLGYTLLRQLSTSSEYMIHGAVRTTDHSLGTGVSAVIHSGIDANDHRSLVAMLERVRPNVLVNCVGLIKQHDSAKDPRLAISLNSLLPHQLAEWCTDAACRLIHFSTDCVFTGDRGDYSEYDIADADDLYGRSKRLGEVDYGGHLTLRTSLIGHGLTKNRSLIDWFLGTKGSISGYAGVIFSGLPTIEIARLLQESILTDEKLSGIYHLSAEPIGKDRLLRLVSAAYGHDVQIARCEQPQLNRSLNSSRLRQRMNYEPPPWEQLIAFMHRDYLQHYARLRA